jgi:uncharacterized RDD family membrane protein YckC
MDEESEHREITVETLSTPPLRIKPAPLTKRVGAAMIDSFIVGLVTILALLASGHGLFRGPESVDYFAFVPLGVIAFAYYFGLEGMFATTIGKHSLKLVVLQKDGEACSFKASLVRNMLRFLDWLPLLYILGALAIAISKDRQRIGDRLAGTIVSNAPERDLNPPPAPFLFH